MARIYAPVKLEPEFHEEIMEQGLAEGLGNNRSVIMCWLMRTALDQLKKENRHYTQEGKKKKRKK